MKHSKKLMSLALAMLMTSGLGGCNRRNQGGEGILRIFITNAGYKTEWLNSMIEGFKNADWVKEKYPNLEVRKPEQSNNQEFVQNKFDGGEKANNFDLLFGMNLFDKVTDGNFLDLTDTLYNTDIPDEIGGKYKDRMYQSYLDAFTFSTVTQDERNGRFFMAPWAGGNISFLYNAEFLSNLGKEVPVTTDEFFECCQAYTNANWKGSTTSTTTFALSKGGTSEDYINKMFYIWWAQYEGVQGYDNFWNGIDDGAISVDIFKQKGRLEALKVYENLLKPSNNFISPNAFKNDFMFNQRGFKGGESLFYTCGDWYPSEMSAVNGKGGKNYQALMMRAPVISAIKDQTETIADDAELAALIRAIDAGSTSLTGTGYDVSQDDYDIVLEARGVVNSFGSGHCAVIPTYAAGKDVAVDFLRYMATTDGLDRYMEATMGASLPFTYDVETKNPTLFNSDKIDALHRDRLRYMNSQLIKPQTLKSTTSFVLCVYGYVNEFEPGLSRDYWGTFTSKTNSLTAQKYYDQTITYYNTGDNWSSAVSRAGLNM